MTDPTLDRDAIASLITEAYAGPAWHGPSVKESLAAVTASIASRKLASDRNSIWELVLHLTHGRHLLIERINDAPSAAFPRPIREPWWPIPSPDASDRAWQGDLALLDQYQTRLIETIKRATPAQLARVPQGNVAIARQLAGMALHDAYHAGQIRLLALQLAAPPSP